MGVGVLRAQACLKEVECNKIQSVSNDNNNKTYIAPISILLFLSALKNNNISKKNYQDCLKYTKCMNLPKRVKNNYVNTKTIKIT